MLATLLPATVDAAVPIMGRISWSEFLGATILPLLGDGIVTTNLLPEPEGKGDSWLLVNQRWGLAAFAGVYVAFRTGGYLNPAVTITKAAAHMFGSNITLAGNIPVADINVAVHVVARFLSIFASVVLCWLTFKKHLDEDCDPALKLSVFSASPEIRSCGWNCLTEAIDTAVLILWVFVSGYIETTVGSLNVTLIIVVIDNSLDGPTDYTIGPACDLGPCTAHTILPIKGKGGSDWDYSWIPVINPIIGAIIGTAPYYLILAWE